MPSHAFPQRPKDADTNMRHRGSSLTPQCAHQRCVAIRGTKSDAEAVLSRLLSEDDTPHDESSPPTAAFTVTEYCERWLSEYAEEQVSARTRERHAGPRAGPQFLWRLPCPPPATALVCSRSVQRVGHEQTRMPSQVSLPSGVLLDALVGRGGA